MGTSRSPRKGKHSPANPLNFRHPTREEIKDARRRALAFLGDKDGLSQADAAKVIGHTKRWWSKLELVRRPSAKDQPIKMSFADLALFHVLALGEDPVRWAAGLSGKRKPKKNAAISASALRRLQAGKKPGSRNPLNYRPPTAREVRAARLQAGLTQLTAPVVLGRSPRWWQFLERRSLKAGVRRSAISYSHWALFHILALGEAPAMWAQGLRYVMENKKTGYGRNLKGITVRQ